MSDSDEEDEKSGTSDSEEDDETSGSTDSEDEVMMVLGSVLPQSSRSSHLCAPVQQTGSSALNKLSTDDEFKSNSAKKN